MRSMNPTCLRTPDRINSAAVAQRFRVTTNTDRLKGHRQPESLDRVNPRFRVVAPDSDREVIKVTETPRERELAFRLVHDVYCGTGLIPTNPSGMRLMRHHLSEQTEVLIAKRDGQVSFTVTLVRDAEFGLPLDSLFADEVAAMRRDGIKLAEVSCLAARDGAADKKERFEKLVRMISLTLQTARRRGVDRLLLAVHPRHAKVYQRVRMCRLLGRPRIRRRAWQPGRPLHARFRRPRPAVSLVSTAPVTPPGKWTGHG